MKRPEDGLLSFGGSQHLQHFAADKDVANELFALLTEAKTVYLHDVVLGGKQYHRYVDDFVNGHRYIDCDHAACRNCHEMNIHIVKGLLTECASSVQPCFAAPDFTFNECMKLKRMYDTSESLSPLGPPRINRPAALSLSFGCDFTPEQMEGIVACANTYHLFCVSVRIEDMEALFACKKGFSIRVNNIRRVVILFDALLETRSSNLGGRMFSARVHSCSPRTGHAPFRCQPCLPRCHPSRTT